MISSNIFRAIGDFFTNVVFIPFDALYTLNWWNANVVNFAYIIITIIVGVYWCGQLLKFKRQGRE